MSIRIARGNFVIASRPPYLRRHRRQDRVDIAAGLEAEHRATIVEQVEFDIAAAADQLLLAVFGRPWRIEIPSHQRGINLQELASDILRKAEVVLPVSGVVIIVEDAADAARFLA